MTTSPTPQRPDARDHIEEMAQAIYETWSEQDGFKRWQPYGNSDKQMEARKYARAAYATLPAPAVAPASAVGERSIRRLFGFLDEIFGQEDAIGTDEAESHDVLRAVGDGSDDSGDVALEYSPWMKELRAALSAPPAAQPIPADELADRIMDADIAGLELAAAQPAQAVTDKWRAIWTAGFNVLAAWESHNVEDIGQRVEELRLSLGEIDDPDWVEFERARSAQPASGETK